MTIGALAKVDDQYLATVQTRSVEQAEDYLAKAAKADQPKVAADWTLAARNCADVALKLEQLNATREKGRR